MRESQCLKLAKRYKHGPKKNKTNQKPKLYVDTAKGEHREIAMQ